MFRLSATGTGESTHLLLPRPGQLPCTVVRQLGEPELCSCSSHRWKSHKWRRCQLVPWTVRQDSPGAQETCGPGMQVRGVEHLALSHTHTHTHAHAHRGAVVVASWEVSLQQDKDAPWTRKAWSLIFNALLAESCFAFRNVTFKHEEMKVRGGKRPRPDCSLLPSRLLSEAGWFSGRR